MRFENPGIALETFRSWIFNNEAYIVGPDNQRIAVPALRPHDDAGRSGSGVQVRGCNGPDKLKFIYKTPAMLTNTPLEYEFKDLPLP